MIIKIYECSICKKWEANNIKGKTRFKGTRSVVRKHLTKFHGVKGRKNNQGVTKKEMGESALTSKTISEEFK